MSQYPTNLTDKQWQVTEIILDPQHRKRKYSLRDTMDAIMYIVKTWCRYESCAPYAVQGGKSLLRGRVDGILRPVHPPGGSLVRIAGRKENRQKQY